MKKISSLILFTILTLSAQMAHAGFFSSIIHAISNIPIIGNVVDHFADIAAHRKVDEKVNSYYRSAMSCNPLEADGTLTVREFVRLKPGYPGWKTLEKFESVASSAANIAATKSTNDKVEHCYAGCMVGKQLGYSSGVLVAFLKEMRDASDCSPTTHFEMQDYYATVAGAEASQKTTCEAFCLSPATGKMTGSEMLAAAKSLTKPSYGGGGGRIQPFVRYMEK